MYRKPPSAPPMPPCTPRPQLDPDSAEPLLLQFRRAPGSRTLDCYRTSASELQRRRVVPFLAIQDAGDGRTIFVYADTHERWATLAPSPELGGGGVLDAPALGLLHIPLSTYLDDMTTLFPGSRGAYSMRTRYGCQKWFRVAPRAGDAPGAVTLRAVYPPRDEAPAASVVSALTLVAQEVSTAHNQFQAPHYLPSNADPNLFAKWPFSFVITAVYRTPDEFTLEVTLSDLPASPLRVRDASMDLIHAAVLAAYAINQSIWSHQELP